MPTYEYECLACGHAFERFQKMSDKPVRTCPECGKRKVRRLISSGGGILFKGPGFYATDYRKGPPPAGEKTGEKSERGDGKRTGAGAREGSGSKGAGSASGSSDGGSGGSAGSDSGSGSSANGSSGRSKSSGKDGG